MIPESLDITVYRKVSWFFWCNPVYPINKSSICLRAARTPSPKRAGHSGSRMHPTNQQRQYLRKWWNDDSYGKRLFLLLLGFNPLKTRRHLVFVASCCFCLPWFGPHANNLILKLVATKKFFLPGWPFHLATTMCRDVPSSFRLNSSLGNRGANYVGK